MKVIYIHESYLKKKKHLHGSSIECCLEEAEGPVRKVVEWRQPCGFENFLLYMED